MSMNRTMNAWILFSSYTCDRFPVMEICYDAKSLLSMSRSAKSKKSRVWSIGVISCRAILASTWWESQFLSPSLCRHLPPLRPGPSRQGWPPSPSRTRTSWAKCGVTSGGTGPLGHIYDDALVRGPQGCGVVTTGKMMIPVSAAS